MTLSTWYLYFLVSRDMYHWYSPALVRSFYFCGRRRAAMAVLLNDSNAKRETGGLERQIIAGLGLFLLGGWRRRHVSGNKSNAGRSTKIVRPHRTWSFRDNVTKWGKINIARKQQWWTTIADQKSRNNDIFPLILTVRSVVWCTDALFQMYSH